MSWVCDVKSMETYFNQKWKIYDKYFNGMLWQINSMEFYYLVKDVNTKTNKSYYRYIHYTLNKPYINLVNA